MTTTTLPMLETNPTDPKLDRALLAATIDALIDCAGACTTCADACLNETDVAGLISCIRTNLNCADICAATARVLSRHSGPDPTISRAQLAACVTACAACAAECGRHAGMHEHCRICAEACRRCERACRDLLAAMS
jgi:hypothetical protein